MQAKSYFVHPMPRAAVRISLLTAVEGSGTSSWRPSSIASTISFCIMFTSNQASSGCCKTNGAILNHRRGNRTVHHHIDDGVARNAAFFRQQCAFGKCQHLYGEAQINRDLHRQGEAVVADIRNLRPDIEQDRFYFFECFFSPAHHHRQLALLQSNHAARHWRIDHIRTLFADFGGDRSTHVRTHGADIDEYFARAHSGEQAIRTLSDRRDGGSVSHHRKSEVRSSGDCAG